MKTELDGAILSVTDHYFRKVAMTLARVEEALGTSIANEEFEAEIRFLVEAGRLESAGDLSDYRASEVRRPPRNTN